MNTITEPITQDMPIEATTETQEESTQEQVTMSKLMTEVRRLMQEHVPQDVDEKRNQANLEASQVILAAYAEKIKHQAAQNHTSALIYEWLHSDRTQFNYCFLRDLVSRGDLLERLQMAIDQDNQPGEFVIHLTVTRMPNDPQAMLQFNPRYKLYISWNQEDFARLHESNKEMRQSIVNISNRQRHFREQVYQPTTTADIPEGRSSNQDDSVRDDSVRPGRGRPMARNQERPPGRVDQDRPTGRVDQSVRPMGRGRPMARNQERPPGRVDQERPVGRVGPRQQRQQRQRNQPRQHPGVGSGNGDLTQEDVAVDQAAESGSVPRPMQVLKPTWVPTECTEN